MNKFEITKVIPWWLENIDICKSGIVMSQCCNKTVDCKTRLVLPVQEVSLLVCEIKSSRRHKVLVGRWIAIVILFSAQVQFGYTDTAGKIAARQARHR